MYANYKKSYCRPLGVLALKVGPTWCPYASTLLYYKVQYTIPSCCDV